MPYKDPKKQKEYNQQWYKKNKVNKDKQSEEWRIQNPERSKFLSRNFYLKMLREEPWKQHYKASEQRCNNPNRTGYEYYGLKGIKFLMTLEDFKFLWFRDKAYLMDKPSIDRKDSNKDYILSNCRFLELDINRQRHKIKRNAKGQFERII